MEPLFPEPGRNDERRPELGRSSAMASKAKEQRQKTTAGSKRQKTFTGCWTCRERHVKCDELRPVCNRCTKGNFTCQGYGTRLTWLSPTGQNTPKSCRRSHVLAGVSPLSNNSGQPSNRESSSVLDLPLRSSSSAFRGSGPYSRAKRQSLADHGDKDAVARDQASQDVQADALGAETLQHIPILDVVNDASLLGGTLNDTTGSSNHSGAVRSLYDGRQLGLWPTDCALTSSLEASEAHSIRHTYFQYRPQNPRESFNTLYQTIPQLGNPARPLGLLSAAAQERELINHWVTNLAHKLIPIRSPANPFLTVISPMTLEGSRMAGTKSTCTVALFHAVCAISAAHRANLRGCSPEENELVLHHKQLSFRHLMQNIGCRDHDELMASLSTLCLWVLIHFVTGTTGAWREVVKVTRNLLGDVNADTWNQSATAALTYQSFSSTFALVQAQYFGRLEFPDPLRNHLPSVAMSKSQIMPAQSLELVTSFNAKLLQSNLLAEADLDQLEIEFALSTPEPSIDSAIGNADSAMVHHHRLLFYYASLLYFRCNSGRRGPREQIQDLVARSLDHMEHLESLQKDNSPMTWIYATVAFEAETPELRHRIRCSFFRQKPLGFATWDTLLLAVEEVWRRRDAAVPGFAPEPWTHVLAKMPEYDVILY